MRAVQCREPVQSLPFLIAAARSRVRCASFSDCILESVDVVSEGAGAMTRTGAARIASRTRGVEPEADGEREIRRKREDGEVGDGTRCGIEKGEGGCEELDDGAGGTDGEGAWAATSGVEVGATGSGADASGFMTMHDSPRMLAGGEGGRATAGGRVAAGDSFAWTEARASLGTWTARVVVRGVEARAAAAIETTRSSFATWAFVARCHSRRSTLWSARSA